MPFQLQLLFANPGEDPIGFRIKHVKSQQSIVIQVKSSGFERGQLILNRVHVLDGAEWNYHQPVFAIGAEGAHVAGENRNQFADIL